MAWKEIEDKQRNFESICISIFILCAFWGFIGDALNRYGSPLFGIENLDAISLVILQIQGTIVTLSIAVLSLLGGRITETYMGISLIDYVLNRKPICLSQKMIINLLIVLLGGNVFFHLWGQYNVVFALFFVSEGLILLSTREIYEVFSGHVEIEHEIKSYIMNQVEAGSHADRINLLHKFCNGWKSAIAHQNEPEFEAYQQTFEILFKAVLMDEVPGSRLALQKCAYHIVYTLLSSEIPASRKRGLRLVHEIYKNTWICIRANESKALRFPDGFHLFQEISHDLQDATDHLPVIVVERELRWHTTVEYVLLVNFWVAYDPENPNEIRNLNYFASAMGSYIAKNRTQERHANIWESPFIYMRRLGLHSPAGKQAEMERQWTLILFHYAASLVNSNMLDLLADSMYAQGLANIAPTVDECYAILVLKLHCYIYYIAEYEDVSCVSSELQKSCKEFIRNYNIRRAFSGFLHRISHSKAVFNEALEKRLHKELEVFEFFPLRESSKILKMGGVVRNFVVFTSLYLFGEYDPYRMMEQMFSNEAVKFYLPTYLENPEATIKLLDEFLALLSDSRETNIDPKRGKARVKYAAFERNVKQRLKEIELEEASHQPRGGDSTSKEIVAQQVQQYIEEKFAPILSQDAKHCGEYRIHCFRLDIPSDMSVKKFLKNHYDDISSGLIGGLRDILCKTGALRMVYRSSFQDDREYIDYLENRDASIVLGSDWAFRTQRRNNQELLERYLNGRKAIFSGYSNWGVLLDDEMLQICMKNVHISIRPALIKDSNAKYDPQKNLYAYKPSGTLLEFEKEELANYLCQKRQIVDVVIRLCIKKSVGIIGDLLYMD